MPHDRWAGRPAPVSRRDGGYDLALAVARREGEDEEWHDGIRLHVAALTSGDIDAALAADPDVTDPLALRAEALQLALDATAPTVQAQLDELTDLMLGG